MHDVSCKYRPSPFLVHFWSPFWSPFLVYDPRAKLNETWTTVLGVEASRTFSVTSYDNDGGKITISERAHSPEAKFGDEKNLRTVSRYYPNTAGPASRNKLRETTSQTGEVTRYTYTYGDYLGLEAVPGDFQPAEDAPLRDWLLGTRWTCAPSASKKTPKPSPSPLPTVKRSSARCFAEVARRFQPAMRSLQTKNKAQKTKHKRSATKHKGDEMGGTKWGQGKST